MRCARTPSGGSPTAGEGGEGGEGDDSEESIEAVENMLESYFMQIDSSYDRLVSVGARARARSHPAPEFGTQQQGIHEQPHAGACS
jgi:hypothetical protein